MKTFLKTFFVLGLFGLLLLLGQIGRWYHLGTPRAENETITTEPVELTDSIMKKDHPLNHFVQYNIEVRRVYSRGFFPLKHTQTDTIKKTPVFI